METELLSDLWPEVSRQCHRRCELGLSMHYETQLSEPLTSRCWRPVPGFSSLQLAATSRSRSPRHQILETQRSTLASRTSRAGSSTTSYRGDRARTTALRHTCNQRVVRSSSQTRGAPSYAICSSAPECRRSRYRVR